MPEELSELRKDIKDLSVQMARLTQKLEDMNIPTQPCEYHTKHIIQYHTNTIWDKAKDKAVNTLVAAAVLAVIGYIYIGIAKDLNKAATSQNMEKSHDTKPRP